MKYVGRKGRLQSKIACNNPMIEDLRSMLEELRMFVVGSRGSKLLVLTKIIAASGNEIASLSKNNFCTPYVPMFRRIKGSVMHLDSPFLLMSSIENAETKIVYKFKSIYATVMLQIARDLTRDQQQQLRFYYSTSGLVPMEDTGFLDTLIPLLQKAGMLSWEDVGRLKEGLLAIQRLDLVKQLTMFETKRDLTVLLTIYTRKRLGLGLCHLYLDSVKTTAEYLLIYATEIARDIFDTTNFTSFVESNQSMKKTLVEFEDEIHRRSGLSSPWSKLTMLIVIAGEIMVASLANRGHHHDKVMELCSTAADDLSSRMIKLGSWEDFCSHVGVRYHLVRDRQNPESDRSSFLMKKEIAEVVQKLKESAFFL